MLLHGRIITPDTPPQVLVADDEADVRDLLSQSLTAVGYGCTTAADGKQALELCSQGHFDLVITDLRMPKVHGQELARRLRLANPGLGIIVTTGVKDPRIAVALFEQGVDDVVVKPLHLDEFLARVRRTIMEKQRLARRGADASQPGEAQRTLPGGTRRRRTNTTGGARLTTLMNALDVSAGTVAMGGYCHAAFVAAVTEEIAWSLGLEEHTRAEIRCAALLHDIGEFGLPDGLLATPAPKRNSAQRAAYRDHVRIGAALLGSIPGADVAEAVLRQHHENFDGSGYPVGLSGTEIHQGARTLRIAEVAADALRPGPLTPERIAAVADHLDSLAGKALDPRLVPLAAPALEIVRRRLAGAEERPAPLKELRAGDLLLERITTEDQALLLDRGFVLNAASIDRMRTLNAQGLIPDVVSVLAYANAAT